MNSTLPPWELHHTGLTTSENAQRDCTAPETPVEHHPKGGGVEKAG